MSVLTAILIIILSPIILLSSFVSLIFIYGLLVFIYTLIKECAKTIGNYISDKTEKE